MSDSSQGNWPVPTGSFQRSNPPAVVGQPMYAMPSSAAASKGNGLSVAFILYVLRRWWKLTGLLGLVLAVGAGSLIWFWFEPVYRAEVWLRIRENPESVLDVSARAVNLNRFVATQKALISSPVVMGRVIGQPEVARLPGLQQSESPIDWMEERLDVKSISQSELFQIAFECQDVQGSADAANAVLDAYMQVLTDGASNQSSRIVEILENERERRTSEVKLLRNRVRVLAKTSAESVGTVLSPVGEGVFSQSPIVDLSNQRYTNKLALIMANAGLRAAEEELEQREPISTEEIELALDMSPQLAAYQEAILSLEERLESYSQAIDPEKLSGYRDTKRRIQQYENRLVEERGRLRPEIIKQLQRQQDALRQQKLGELRATVSNHEMLEKELDGMIEEERERLESRSGQELDLEFARDDLNRAQQLYAHVSDRLEQMKTELRAPERVTALQRASKPRIPEEWLPWKQLFAGCGMAMILPFGLVVFWEHRIRRIAEPRQLRDELQLPVVGEVTSLPVQLVDPTRKSSRRLERLRQTFEESVDAVCNNLTLSEKLRDRQVLCICSAVSREGKTHLASQLAISLAQNSHEPILLIDADLRSPDLHNLFDHELDPGLVETLHGKHAPAETIRTTWCKNLHLMPAGRLNCSPHLLLGNGNFETLLSQLRHAYRYIVVDAPPVLPASDSLILANAADGTLLATMRDVSRTTQVREASQRLQHAGANLLGAVLSGVPMRTYTQRYGTYGVGRGMEEEYDEGYEEAEYAEAGHDDAENQAAETEQHEPG